jgi:hypothetical protein
VQYNVAGAAVGLADTKANWQDARTWAKCVRIGELMASEAQRIIQNAEPQIYPALACYAREVKFPVASDLMWIIILESPLNYPYNSTSCARHSAK